MIETFATVVNGFQPLTIVTKLYILDICGSSRPKVFCQKGVFRNFAKFTGKHLCQTFYFNKVSILTVSGLQFYLKRDSGTDIFL